MLLRLEAGGMHQAFAEIQEAANFEAEVRQGLVINGSWRCFPHSRHIISYYDVYARMEIVWMCVNKQESLQRLAEGFLRLHVRVAVPFVEGMRPVAYHIRA